MLWYQREGEGGAVDCTKETSIPIHRGTIRHSCSRNSLAITYVFHD
jgi:hypothetical protein